MNTTIGVRCGQKKDKTAICVAEHNKRVEPNTASGVRRKSAYEKNTHFIIRHLEQLELGATFPAIAERITTIVQGVQAKNMKVNQVNIDLTGFGTPLRKIMKEVVPANIIPVYFNHGDQKHINGQGMFSVINLGKAYLVCELQTLLQMNRIHLPRTPEAEVLAQELLDYEIEVDEDANNKCGAFQVGTQDNLVTALGLAVQPCISMHWVLIRI